MERFKISSEYKPTGDQPQAIDILARGVLDGRKHQTLMGVTGSGKTFTMANIIERVQKPTLVISHNKTLAAQLHGEFKEFFPDNAVEYFVSYYDYYQPEAYVASTDTYIEKDSDINDEIEKLRPLCNGSPCRAQRCNYRCIGILHIRTGFPCGLRKSGNITQTRYGKRAYRAAPQAY